MGEHPKDEVKEEGSPKAYRRHVQQVSLYRLLLAENGIGVSSAEIVYQDMAEQVRIPVELLPIQATWDLLQSCVAAHAQEGLPPIINDPQEAWECEWCPVRTKCEETNGSPVGNAALGDAEAAEA